ncbi:RES family NAD+ phosphorylase [Caballeronia sp. SEWSISQ10-4 2]|uniref:RES family NAD+ phosphorylase n=1 Tax=Caballeronia sp. SEWSISQ10-4 2 TaxID=2937438 RepID=UPI002651067A|nr:RES family NAD+ phosphorylase [Caballeronia sp. SEWSISQ10-4 2]MDN7179380.1 RES family NAD+ phosphorylase [Caballeronia sp. SEWSISQ10-4 2]
MSPVLPFVILPAGTLLQHVSRTPYRDTPLHFGRSRVNRYDAPDGTYGVLYLGPDLATVLMESVFHQHQWHRRKTRTMTMAEVQGRVVRAVGVMDDIRLFDLTAPGVMVQHFGLNLEQLSSRRYVHTQRISHTVYGFTDDAQASLFDGLVYPSRNNFPAICIALFERARPKVDAVADIDLADHVDWPAFVTTYRLGIIPDIKAR